MNFPAQLTQLRQARGLTQRQVADTAGIHVNQIKRYEAGTTQPTLEALAKVAKALHISLDHLVFGENQRGPDEDLQLQFEAVSALDDDDKLIIREVLEGLIEKYEAKRRSRIGESNALKAAKC
jgi:transcriptional regulator with XRE-family HTH domain